MPEPPATKSADLLRRLNRFATRRGWDIDIAEGGGHTKVRFNGRRATVPRHAADLKTGTFRGILTQLDLSERDLEVSPMRYAYPFDMETQPEGGFAVTFPDVPEAIT